ncbi:hypothetical protein EV421DRAFT_1994347 [Armillaria borealis]|uniref:Uncharacterized protein n=1 Tax=Armillaria borealis TaxID=47425 RepID=A0AA39J1S4_9AGAR|nr:hypothetical protein EV421DRAFT_1994347 [Armillaria borealis]
MATQQLPLHGSNKAPQWVWRGPEDNTTLPVFLDEVEQTCRSVGKTDDKDFIDASILYTDPSASELWKQLPAAKATPFSWANFKTQCFSYYPKSNVTNRYSPVHLEQAVQRLRMVPIHTLDDFGRYDRFIMAIGLDLRQGTSPLLSEFPSLNYTNPLSMQYATSGLSQPLHADPNMMNQLVAPQSLPSMADGIKALTESNSGGYLNELYPQYGYQTYSMPALAQPQPYSAPQSLLPPQPPMPLQSSTPISEPAPSATIPAVKQEDALGGLVAALKTIVEESIARGSNANRKCAYNGCDKRWKDCENRRADQDKGWIKWDPVARKTLMPDGTEIPKGLGAARDWVIKWHSDKNTPAPAAVNLISANRPIVQKKATIPEIIYPSHFSPYQSSSFMGNFVTPSQLAGVSPPSGPVSQMLATVPDNEFEEEENKLQEMVHEYFQGVLKACARKKGKDSSKSSEDQSGQASSASNQEAPAQETEDTTTSSTSTTAAKPKDKAPAVDSSSKPKEARQYRHAAPIMTKGVTEDIVKRLLDAKVMLTVGEVFSESAAVRSRIKEVLTNRKVPILLKGSGPAAVGKDAFVFMTLQEGYHEQIMVTDVTAGLRALTPIIDGLAEVESILDEGCQVVSMSWDVWNKLGLPMDTSIRIQLQSANKGKDQSEGMCHNVTLHQL